MGDKTPLAMLMAVLFDMTALAAAAPHRSSAASGNPVQIYSRISEGSKQDA